MNSLVNKTQLKLISTDIIMATKLPQFIRIKSNKISKANQLRLRKIHNIKFKGVKRKAQKKKLMDYAKSIRTGNKKFKNEMYAYRFLARSYNLDIHIKRDEILKARKEAQKLNKERRKVKGKLMKELIKLKLKMINFVDIGKETFDLLGSEETLKTIQEVMKNTFAVIRAKFTDYLFIDDDNDEDNMQDFERFYTLSQENIAKILMYLTDRVKSNDTLVSDETWSGSVERFKGVRVEIPKYDDKKKLKSGKVKTKNSGGFFNYLQTTQLDLTRYGIYNKVNPDNYKDNCLIKALRNSGIDEARVNLAKGFVVNRQIPMCKLGFVAKKLKICIRVQYLGNKKASVYGKEFSEVVRLGMLDKHYFLIEKVDFTSYALKNIDTLMSAYDSVEEIKNIYKLKDETYKRSNQKFTDSYKVVKFLLENKQEYLLPISIDNKILETQFIDYAFDLDDLKFTEENVLLNEIDLEKENFKAEKSKEWTKWFFDFETYKSKIKDEKVEKRMNELKVNGKNYVKEWKKLKRNLYKFVHTPYMCCAISDEGKRIITTGKYCGSVFLRLVQKYTKVRTSNAKSKKKTNTIELEKPKIGMKKALLIAHNAGYDYRFIRKYLFMVDEKCKGTGLMNAKGRYMNFDTKECMEVQVKDSLKLISMGLAKFGKVFDIKQAKEIMPYGLYNSENLEKNWVDIRLAKPYLKSEEQFITFKRNVRKLKLSQKIDGIEVFDLMKYSEYYCMRDCEVLNKGYETFRGWILKELKIDIDGVWTIASLADKYLKLNGVYDGVYQLSGLPQIFIQKCVVGGRTMCRNNVKKIFDGTIEGSDDFGKRMADYDGVSLYPSAMVRMLGTLKGIPKILEGRHLNKKFLDSVDGYFVKIRLLEIGIKRDFSLISDINENGVRVFCNECEKTDDDGKKHFKEYYVDKTTLEDWIEFQDIKYEIIRGYYYDEGRNPKIREVLQYLFDTRVKYKKIKNPIQVIYKLIMNASYGKSILKPINTEDRIIDGEEKANEFLRQNYNFIIEYEKLYDCNKTKFKLHKSINEHFNNCCVGVEILSMSKRIMNEVMCLAEDEGLEAYYQDTDSIHIVYDDVAKLKEKFTEKYGRNLDGKKLGQFHIDFELKDNGVECVDLYAEKSIFLGKKCYIDCLVGINPETNKIVRGYHIRMKGVPNTTIYHTAKKLGINMYELYMKLYEGEKIKFDLLEAGNRCNFKFHNNGEITSMSSFERVISFA